MKAHVRFEHQLLAVETEHRVHCMLELQAPPAPQDRPRPLFHLALVLDRSGSMAGRKLEVVRECAGFLVRRLAPTDELALIAYDDEVQLLAPLAPVDQSALTRAIGRVHPGGQTNLSGGWLKGAEELRRTRGEGPRKILLLTDGLANVGVTDPEALVAMARLTAEEQDVGTTTIGFGEDFDEDLLTAMAEAGRGNAHFAETPDAAPGIFAEELEGLLSLVAQNVSVEIRPSAEVQLLGILNDFSHVPVPGGVQIQLGDAYGDEGRRVVFELHVPELASLGVVEIAEVVLRSTTIGREIAQHELRLPLVVNLVAADEAAASEADREVTEEVIVLTSARAQKQARELADRGKFDEAHEVLSDAAKELRRVAKDSAQAEELAAQAGMLSESLEMMSPASYDLRARKRMSYQSWQSLQRRKRQQQQPPP